MGIMTLPVLGFDPMSLGHTQPMGWVWGMPSQVPKETSRKGRRIMMLDDVMMIDDVTKSISDGKITKIASCTHCISGSFPVVGPQT